MILWNAMNEIVKRKDGRKSRRFIRRNAIFKGTKENKTFSAATTCYMPWRGYAGTSNFETGSGNGVRFEYDD